MSLHWKRARIPCAASGVLAKRGGAVADSRLPFFALASQCETACVIPQATPPLRASNRLSVVKLRLNAIQRCRMEIARELYVNRLVARKHNGLVKVITGIRRCGKSYLLMTLFKRHLLESGVPAENILIYEFDRWQSRQFRNPAPFFADLEQKMSSLKGQKYVLLDEVQMLTDFSEVLNSLLREPAVDLYVTGSNLKFLSSDFLTEIRG